MHEQTVKSYVWVLGTVDYLACARLPASKSYQGLKDTYAIAKCCKMKLMHVQQVCTLPGCA